VNELNDVISASKGEARKRAYELLSARQYRDALQLLQQIGVIKKDVKHLTSAAFSCDENAEYLYSFLFRMLAFSTKPDADNAVNLAISSKEIGQYSEALHFALIAAKIDPGEDTCRLVANMMRWQERFDDAIAWYSRSLEFKPDESSTLNNFGLVYLQIGEYDKAIEKFQSAIEIDPNDPVVRSNFVKALYYQGAYKECLDEYSVLQKPDIDNTELLLCVAGAYAAVGQLPLVSELLKQAHSDWAVALALDVTQRIEQYGYDGSSADDHGCG
jgi:tetratricopeptide (TPR) repeat protein